MCQPTKPKELGKASTVVFILENENSWMWDKWHTLKILDVMQVINQINNFQLQEDSWYNRLQFHVHQNIIYGWIKSTKDL